MNELGPLFGSLRKLTTFHGKKVFFFLFARESYVKLRPNKSSLFTGVNIAGHFTVLLRRPSRRVVPVFLLRRRWFPIIPGQRPENSPIGIPAHEFSIKIIKKIQNFRHFHRNHRSDTLQKNQTKKQIQHRREYKYTLILSGY